MLETRLSPLFFNLIKPNLIRLSSTFQSYGLEKKWAHYDQKTITAEAEKVWCFIFLA